MNNNNILVPANCTISDLYNLLDPYLNDYRTLMQVSFESGIDRYVVKEFCEIIKDIKKR